jgi:HSP20 family molecular chaperone IbpA
MSTPLSKCYYEAASVWLRTHSHFASRLPLRFREDADGRTVLTIALPQASGEALDLRRREHELILTVGGWRRVIALPASLAGRAVKARLAGGNLDIRFEAND